MLRLLQALAFILFASHATAQTVSPQVVKEIAPEGKLQAAINFGNPVLAQKDATTGEPRGISADLSRELARRLGVPVEFVLFEAAGKVADAVKAGAWDIAFLAIDPGRANDIAFTAPYVVIEGTYLVPADSPLRTIADVDREGAQAGGCRPGGRADRRGERERLTIFPDPGNQKGPARSRSDFAHRDRRLPRPET